MILNQSEALTLFANGPVWDFRGFWPPDEWQAEPGNGYGPYYMLIGVLHGFVEGIPGFWRDGDDRPGVITEDDVRRYFGFQWLFEQFGPINASEEMEYRMFGGWDTVLSGPSIQGMLNLDFLNFVHTPSQSHFERFLWTMLHYVRLKGQVPEGDPTGTFTDSEYVLNVIIAKCLEHGGGFTLSSMITTILECRLSDLGYWEHTSDDKGLVTFYPGAVNAVVRTWLPKLYRDGTPPLVDHFSALRTYDPAVFLPVLDPDEEVSERLQQYLAAPEKLDPEAFFACAAAVIVRSRASGPVVSEIRAVLDAQMPEADAGRLTAMVAWEARCVERLAVVENALGRDLMPVIKRRLGVASLM